MNSPTTTEEVLEYYQQRLTQEQDSIRSCAGRWNSVAYLRGGLFLFFLAALLMAFANAWELAFFWWVVAGLLFVAFLVVAYIHEGMQKELRRATILSNMHRESIARCNRNWDEIKVPEIEVPREFIPISKDLDLLGPSSVYKLLGVTRTPLGTETLRRWIVDGALADEVKLRQGAVDELKPELEWRLKFRLLCEQLTASQSAPSRFVDWSC